MAYIVMAYIGASTLDLGGLVGLLNIADPHEGSNWFDEMRMLKAL